MNARMKATAAVIAALAVGVPVGLSASSAFAARHHHGAYHHGRYNFDRHDQIKHVLLISVDGLHQSDVNWYVAKYPHSELAKLATGGAEFSDAHTSVPSDSDPGGTALMTGGDPRATGVYYDVEYNHNLYEAGTKACKGPGAPPLGADVIYDSPDDLDVTRLDAGQGIPGLLSDPSKIMQMTGQPQTLLNPMTFPVDPKTCLPIYPSSYLKVNTMFEVAHDAGLLTAWSDKHPVYESFNGPSGTGIDDLFTPEIDSNAIDPHRNPVQGLHGGEPDRLDRRQRGDEAVRRLQGAGDHQRDQRLRSQRHVAGRYAGDLRDELPDRLDGREAVRIPGCDRWRRPDSEGRLPARDHDAWPAAQQRARLHQQPLQAMDQEIQKDGLAGSTAIIVTAKHGQSPQDPNQLLRIPDGPIIDAINAAWTAAHPGAGNLIVAGTDDDLWQSYLSDRSQAAADFVANYLWNHTAQAVDYAHTGGPATVTVQHSGLAKIYAGQAAADFFGVPASDPRHPDVFGRVQVGVVYTGGTKIAEHGGDNPADRSVPLLVYAPGAVQPSQDSSFVETTQVAPTILRLLGLDPDALKAVRIEGTQVLPGVS